MAKQRRAGQTVRVLVPEDDDTGNSGVEAGLE
jgi:hypothetical protein